MAGEIESSEIKHLILTGTGAVMPSAFENNTELETVILGDGITSLGARAFYGCTALETVELGSGITEIGEPAFANCGTLRNMELPSTVETMGSGVFENCNALETLSLPFTGESKTGDGNTHFSYIFGAETPMQAEEYVPQSLHSITLTGEQLFNDAFIGCEYVKEIHLPDGIVEIPEGAFSDCKFLTEIVIPESVTEIEKAFAGCDSLLSLTIPCNVTYIADDAFTEVQNLYEIRNLSPVTINTENTQIKNVYNDPADSKITVADGLVFYKEDGQYVLIGYTGQSLELVLLEDIDGQEYQFAEDVFTKFMTVKSIALPKFVTEIGEEMFSGCTNLETIVLPDTVTKIGYGAFTGCSSLQTLSVPHSVTILDAYTFSECVNLKNIYLPKSLTFVSNAVFNNYTALTDVYYEGTENEWSSVIIQTEGFGGNNNPLLNAEKHYNTLY